MAMKPDRADPEALAINALGFLASDDERLSRFLGVTGLTPQTLRKAAQDPGFLGAVLDYLVADESLLISFAANSGIDPARVADAAYRLHGSPDIGS